MQLKGEICFCRIKASTSLFKLSKSCSGFVAHHTSNDTLVNETQYTIFSFIFTNNNNIDIYILMHAQ